MVDRITPAPDDQRRRWVVDELGVKDRWPVVCEPFRQWVVEDAFAGSRPPWDQVGAQLVSDVGPYKLVKTRLLNGGHCALGHLGLLSGCSDTGEAMANPMIKRYVSALMATEISPEPPRVPGVDLVAYQQTLLDRFSNPVLVDPLTRLAARASTKLPAYLLPSLSEAVRQDRPYELLALAPSPPGSAACSGPSSQAGDASSSRTAGRPSTRAWPGSRRTTPAPCSSAQGCSASWGRTPVWARPC